MRYTLNAIRDECTGELGLIVDGMGFANDGTAPVASDGRLIAHDLLEHVNGAESIGPLSDEMQALGAVMFGRYRAGMVGDRDLIGDYARCYRDHWHWNHEGVREDIPRMFHGGIEASEILDDMRESIVQDICDELSYEDERVDKRELSRYLRFAEHYARIGYSKARRKYGTWRTLTSKFFAIQQAVDKVAKFVEFEGQRYTLQVIGCDARCEEDYGEEYY